jgi:hypothetical protein
MSAGAVFQEVLRILNRQHLPEVSQRDLLAALEACHPELLTLVYEAGAEAGLPRQKLLTRAAAIYFNLCAVHLADDLTDGQCTYLVEPFRIGPCVQFILQNLFFHTLAEADLPGPMLSEIARELVITAGSQHIEVRTRQWSAPVFREVAEGISGRPWSAHLQILWHGTALVSRAKVVGMNLGVVALVAEDIRDRDPRYTSLPDPDRREVVAWAVAAIQALRGENLRCLDAPLRAVDSILKEAL